MKTIAFLAASGLCLLSACVSPPPRTDALSGISVISRPRAAGAYKNLSLALILSPDSKGAIAYLEEFNKHLFRQNYWGSAKVDTSKLFMSLTDILAHHFKTVEQAGDLGEAAQRKPDLVAVLDVYTKIAPPPGKRTTTFEAKVVFLSPAGAQLETIGAATTATIPYNRSSSGVEAAAAEAGEKLEAALTASAKLRELAQAAPAAPPAVAAAPVAPAAPADARRSAVDRPSYRLQEDARNFAVVIGVEEYESLPRAEFAERDAAATREHLLALGYPQRNIVYLTGSKASRSGIEKYLESWLPRNVTEESKVFVYFSGHGAPDVASDQAFLMPWDGDSKFIENTGYPVKRMYEKLNALKARQVVVAMDSCFSGAGGRSVLAKGARPLVTKTDLGGDSVQRLVVFAASGGDEISGTDDSQGHGLFTYQFLRALDERKGEVTVKGLYEALRPRVQDTARRENRDQTPQLLPAALGERAGLKLR